VVVGDFYIVGIATFPPETDSVLVIDPDAELALPITFQSFQPVTWGRFQIVKFIGGFKVVQLAPNLTLDVHPSSHTPPSGDLFRLDIPEGSDHRHIFRQEDVSYTDTRYNAKLLRDRACCSQCAVLARGSLQHLARENLDR